MERMKTRFIIAVTDRLAPAAESSAKVELIEELSDNLYSRWKDLVSGGLDEEEAYRQALEDLGDVDELLAYLASLGPEGELPRQESTFRDFTNELLHGVEDIVRETVNQTRDAVDQATIIVRNVTDKLREKYPDGFKGKVYVHFDGDDAGQAPVNRETPEAGEGVCLEPEETQAESGSKGWSFSMGYDRNRGGFFCESGHSASRKVTGTAFSSQDLKGLDIQLVNGDVTVSLDSDAGSDVRLDGDVEQLEVRINDSGVLSIRQGNTASSSFFFHRGLASADVELTLPKRFWEFVQITATNGDIDIEDGLEAGKIALKTASGDVTLGEVACTELSFKTGSGDLDGGGSAETVRIECGSGDIDMDGSFGTFRAATGSGDIEVRGMVREVRCSSGSGDVEVDTQVMPEQMEISSKSGDCDVTMPGGQGFSLQFSTVSGDLDTDFPLVGPVGARSGEAMYLDGGGRTFRISSISGDISLRQQ